MALKVIKQSVQYILAGQLENSERIKIILESKGMVQIKSEKLPSLATEKNHKDVIRKLGELFIEAADLADKEGL